MTSFATALQSIVPKVVITSAAAVPALPVPRSPTFDELCEDYIANYSGRDPAIGWRLTTWRRLLGPRRVLEITPDDVRECLRRITAEPARAYRGRDADGNPIHRIRAPRRAPSTINRYHAMLSAVLQWGIETGRLPATWRNPARGLKRARENPGVVRFLDDDERRRLLAACRASTWPKLYALVLFALTSGARRSELLGLRWRDIDLQRRVAHLPRTKNGEPRTLVIVPAVADELARFVRGKPEHLVFCSRRDPMRPAAITQAWIAALRQAKVERFRFHDLRHSFASALAQAGASLIEVADALGHRSFAMTKRYAHLSAASRAALINRVLGDMS